MSKVSKNDLFGDFAPFKKEEWRKITEAGLKGKPFEKLIWNPAPPLSIEPYYTQEDISDFSINFLISYLVELFSGFVLADAVPKINANNAVIKMLFVILIMLIF